MIFSSSSTFSHSIRLFLSLLLLSLSSSLIVRLRWIVDLVAFHCKFNHFTSQLDAFVFNYLFHFHQVRINFKKGNTFHCNIVSLWFMKMFKFNKSNCFRFLFVVSVVTEDFFCVWHNQFLGLFHLSDHLRFGFDLSSNWKQKYLLNKHAKLYVFYLDRFSVYRLTFVFLPRAFSSFWQSTAAFDLLLSFVHLLSAFF